MTAAVLKGMRWTYLGTGMTHPNFLATVEAINLRRESRLKRWPRHSASAPNVTMEVNQ